MTKSSYCRAASLFAFLVASHAVKADPNLVVNGGFEAEDFSGWSLTNATPDMNFVSGDYGTTEGNWSAVFGQTSFDGPVTISQTIATVPGAAYELSFDLGSSAFNSEDPFNSFTADFGSASFLATNMARPDGFVHYTLNAIASSDSTTLSFSFFDDPEFFVLDNAQINPVPEPASVAALGIGALGLMRRRRA